MGKISENELKEILDKHKIWIDSSGEDGDLADLSGAGLRWADLRWADLSGADLRWADLRGADLSGANLNGADLSGTDLSGADLRGADLSGADLRWADLRWADLRGANLRGADLSGADLSGTNLGRADLSRADLRWANLRGANLRGADLSRADLRWADLRGADLSGANLNGADLSGTTGIITASDYLTSHFERCDDGYIAYKTFGLYYTSPKNWVVKKGAIIQETVNANRTDSCGCGINVATKDWLKKNNPNAKKAWKVLIKWEWLADVIVPYNTDGKIRCGKVMLLDEERFR